MRLAFHLALVTLASNTHDVVLDRHIIGRQIVERGRSRGGSVVELKTRVVPRTADGVADEDALVERRAVVSALAANREPVRRDVHEQHRLAERVTRNELAGRNTSSLDPFGKIGPGQLIGVFGHFCLLRRFCAASRWATNAGPTFVTRSFTCAFWIAGMRVLLMASITAL